MKVEILNIALGMLIAFSLLEFLMFLLLCAFGKKYSVIITSGYGTKYYYGVTAWSKNGAIIKALENFRWELGGDNNIALISNIDCIRLH